MPARISKSLAQAFNASREQRPTSAAGSHGKGRNKFGAVRSDADGISFASGKEMRRYLELKVLQKAGVISGLRLQPRYPLSVNGALICTYVGDFEYREGDRLVVEDAKGFKTPVYRIKAKLFAALHGFSVREV